MRKTNLYRVTFEKYPNKSKVTVFIMADTLPEASAQAGEIIIFQGQGVRFVGIEEVTGYAFTKVK